MANKRPFFARSIFSNIEILAVIGIFTLYALEFVGISTYTQFFPEEFQEQTIPIGGLSVTGEQAEVKTTLLITGLLVIGVSTFLIVIRSRR